MTAASNSEARKRAAGIAASVPTAQEPAPTLGDAPGADSEALAAREALADLLLRHGHVEWTEHDGRVVADAILGSSWLADHDRQTAERAWDEGFTLADQRWQDSEYSEVAWESDLSANPYSEEARRG